jgi:uncharacterized protein YcfL
MRPILFIQCNIILASFMLAGCFSQPEVKPVQTPVANISRQEEKINGAQIVEEAKNIVLGVKYHIFLDAAKPDLKTQYFKLHLDANTPISQRLSVSNAQPNKTIFSGRCTLYEKNAANQYILSLLKLGGAWNAEGEGSSQEKKSVFFSNADIIFKVFVETGSGFFDLKLEKCREISDAQ